MIFQIIALSLFAFAEICGNPPGQTINFYVVSDFNTKVIGSSTESDSGPVYEPAWTARIPEAIWIWDKLSGHNPITNTFKTQFAIPGSPSYGKLHIAFDDILESVIVNNKDSGCKFSSYMDGSEKICDILPYLVHGINTVYFTVKNEHLNGGLLYLMNISITI